jgi:two-component system sensor histidine kinase AlgZ
VHPILSNRRTLILYLAVWLVIGLLMEIPFIKSYSEQWQALLFADIPMNLLYAFICLSSYYLCRVFPIKTTKWYKLITTFFVVAAVAGGVLLLIAYGWITAIDSAKLTKPIADVYEPWVAGIYSWTVFIFLLVAAIHYIIISFEQSKEAERRTLELQVFAQNAELRALRAQIDPHFLFNSLNSISALTASDPAKARSMTIMLGNFFRKSLNLSAQKHILLDEELDLISEFLTIEQVRFGTRLKVEQSIKDECHKIPIPPLLLQPLVENAVRHGIAHLIDGGTVRIACERRGDDIFIEVENPVDPDRPVHRGTGLGIKNVRMRLDTLYGNESHVDVIETEYYFRVKLSFRIKWNE